MLPSNGIKQNGQVDRDMQPCCIKGDSVLPDIIKHMPQQPKLVSLERNKKKNILWMYLRCEQSTWCAKLGKIPPAREHAELCRLGPLILAVAAEGTVASIHGVAAWAAFHGLAVAVTRVTAVIGVLVPPREMIRNITLCNIH